jgi:hypothetical protein
MEVYIDDEYMEEIKSVLAFPSVTNVILTDAQIQTLCVWPAMRDYFIKFPVRDQREYSITSGSETYYDFPDFETFGVSDVRVVDKDSATSGSSSSFWDLWAHQQRSQHSKYSGQYGIRGYNPNSLRQYNSLRRNEMATESNKGTVKYRLDEGNRRVYVYTSIGGKLNITWAKWSDDFDFVKFAYQHDVIKLAQSNLLAHFANTTDIVDAGGDVTINYSEIRSQADELRTSVMERWEAIPDVVAIRMQ